MTEDRSRPPPGYNVWEDSESPTLFVSVASIPAGDYEDSVTGAQRDEAIAAAWAHRDAIASRALGDVLFAIGGDPGVDYKFATVDEIVRFHRWSEGREVRQAEARTLRWVLARLDEEQHKALGPHAFLNATREDYGRIIYGIAEAVRARLADLEGRDHG